MKLAVLTGIDKPTTIESKGGIEVWTAKFCLEEASRNKNIDLYGVRGSVTGEHINLIEILNKPLPDFYTDSYFTDKPEEFTKRKEQFMSTIYTHALMSIESRQESYDIIIDSCSYPSFSFNSHFLKKPVLTIGHFPENFATKFYIDTFGIPKNNYFVFISQFQLKQADFIPENQKTVIHHGINVNDFIFYPEGEDHMTWISRFHTRMNKGLEDAMRVSNEMKLPLNAKVIVEKTSEKYFLDNIMPLESKYAQITRTQLTDKINTNDVFGRAKLFLFPVRWEEPFGLVMIESMASGTPVVAFAKGSAPEIIKDGQTGFIVNYSKDDIRGDWVIKKTGIEGLREAVERIFKMPADQYRQMRRNCRKHIEEKFTVQRMVNDYEKVYQQIIP